MYPYVVFGLVGVVSTAMSGEYAPAPYISIPLRTTTVSNASA